MFLSVLLLFAGLYVSVESHEQKTCVTKDLLQMLISLEWDKSAACRHHSKRDDKAKPAFFATLTTHPFTLNGINDVVKFNNMKINRGGGYNPSTGVFTAPRNGLYQISSMLVSYGKNVIQFSLMKNNSAYVHGYTTGDVDYGTQTVSSVMDLKKGDKVYIKHRTNNNQKILGNHFSSFSGHFLYE